MRHEHEDINTVEWLPFEKVMTADAQRERDGVLWLAAAFRPPDRETWAIRSWEVREAWKLDPGFVALRTRLGTFYDIHENSYWERPLFRTMAGASLENPVGEELFRQLAARLEQLEAVVYSRMTGDVKFLRGGEHCEVLVELPKHLVDQAGLSVPVVLSGKKKRVVY